MLGRGWWWVVMVCGCSSPPPPFGMSSTGEVGTSSGDSEAGSSSSSSGDGSSSDDAEGTETGTPMPKPPKLCSLAVIDPAADPGAVIDAGDGEGQIPTIVGEVLLRNCGCHYTDEVTGYVDYMSNAQPIATLGDFHDDFKGTFPQNYETMPTYLAVEQRVVFANPLPMPSIECGVEGEPGTITAADLEVLAQWLAAGAPDGASYPR